MSHLHLGIPVSLNHNWSCVFGHHLCRALFNLSRFGSFARFNNHICVVWHISVETRIFLGLLCLGSSADKWSLELCFSLYIAAKPLMWMPIFSSFQPKFQLLICILFLPEFCLCTCWFNVIFTWLSSAFLTNTAFGNIAILLTSLDSTTPICPLCKFTFYFFMVDQFLSLRC